MSEPIVLLEREDSYDFLRVSFLVATLPWQGQIPVPLLAAITQTVHSERGNLPPLGMLTDLILVLRQGVELHGIKQDASVEVWEDMVLQRIRSSPLLDSFFVLSRKDADTPAFLSLAILHILERILPADVGFDLPAAHVRSFFSQWISGTDPNFATATVRYEEDCFALRTIAGETARSVLSLLTPGDLVTLRFRSLLSTRSQRTAAQQAGAVLETIFSTLPKKIRSSGKLKGRVATNLKEEDTYPMGGFSSMSTQGSLENLVSTELIYTKKAEKGPNLFLVRWAEGELLYFTRDDSVSSRPYRRVFFVFPTSIQDLRRRKKGNAYQDVIYVIGIVAATILRCLDLLRKVNLEITIWCDGHTQAEEKQLLQLFLQDVVTQGRVSFLGGSGTEQLVAEIDTVSTRGLVDVIHLTSLPFLRDDWEKKGIREHVVTKETVQAADEVAKTTFLLIQDIL